MSSFDYIAILGRQPELGLVELESLFGASALEPFGRQAAVLTQSLDVDRFGGVLKVGMVLYRGPATSLKKFPFNLGPLPMRESKTPFGLSAYGGRETPRDLMSAGLALKKKLRSQGPVRLIVPSKGTVLSAAELRHNRVLDEGFELVVVVRGSEMIVARTTGVQDIDWYSKRDYERPARSAKVGMLPPKLAQVMVNATRGDMVADPFCGTGVVMQEALLLGRSAWGADLAQEMVGATRKNLEWLAGQSPTPLPAWSASEADARSVTLPPNCAVVSEGYLGKHLTSPPSDAELGVLRSELLDLYVKALRNWAKQLAPGAEVTLCVPAWSTRAGWRYLGLVDEVPRLGYTAKSFQHVQTSVMYARDDQIVGRQILMLKKN